MIQDVIRKINLEKSQAENDLKQRQNKAHETEILLEFLTKSFAEFIKQIASGKYDVNVKFPDVQNVKGEVSVQGLTSLLHSMNELQNITKKNKLELPKTQEITGEVTVKNQPDPIKLPEYPKQIKTDVITLPKYVGEKLDEIKKELSKIEVKPQVNVETKASDVSIDLEGVKSRLEGVVEAIKRIQVTPEVNIDLKSVISACEKTTKAINNLKFPVPSFKSSWSHSLTMRAEDLGKEFTYTTDGTTKAVETITVHDVDGGTYVKTYTYSGDGSGDPVTESAWVRA